MSTQPTTPYMKRRQQQRVKSDIARFLESGGRIRQFTPDHREVRRPRIANRVQQRRLDQAERRTS